MARGGTQLFVGRLSKETTQRDLENVFYLYGKLSRCDIKYGECLLLIFIAFWAYFGFIFASTVLKLKTTLHIALLLETYKSLSNGLKTLLSLAV